MSAKKLLLVDTNVISHALSRNQIQCYIDLFKELEKTHIFIVTGFTKYELLRSSDKAHKQTIEDYLSQNMSLVDLSDVLVKFSSRVYYLYKKHPHINVGISDGDIINAAFSIAKPCSILTMDNTDYPRLLFKEEDRFKVDYLKPNGKSVTDSLYLLSPDLNTVRDCFVDYDA